MNYSVAILGTLSYSGLTLNTGLLTVVAIAGTDEVYVQHLLQCAFEGVVT